MPCCAVYGCYNSNHRNSKLPPSERVTFHSFPRDESVLRQWLAFCARKDNINVRHATICDQHFTIDDRPDILKHRLLGYTPKNFRKLKPDAIPTVRGPEVLSAEEVDCQTVERTDKRGKQPPSQSERLDISSNGASDSTIFCGPIVVELDENLVTQPGSSRYSNLKEEWIDDVKVKQEEEDDVTEAGEDPLGSDNEEEPAAVPIQTGSLETATYEVVKRNRNDTIDEHDVDDVTEDLAVPLGTHIKEEPAIQTGVCTQEDGIGDMVNWEVEDDAELVNGYARTRIKEEPAADPIQIDEVEHAEEELSGAGEGIKTDVDDILMGVEGGSGTAVWEDLPQEKVSAPQKYYKLDLKKQFAGAFKLTTHKMMEKPYQCDVCNSSFTRADHLRSHQMIHTGEKPYKCDECNYSFIQASTLNRHKLTHVGAKPYKCDVCKCRFACVVKLETHMTVHCVEKPFGCDVCDSRFSRATHLRSHKLNHSGEKPYKCDVCNSSFIQASSLKAHLMIHTGEKPFKCDLCNSSFIQASSLNRHKLTHSGEKSFKCYLCNSTFTRASTLKTHLMIHSGEKPYKCDVCKASFIQASTLKTHKRVHTGEKPYQCDVCNSSFSRANHLKCHKMNHRKKER